MGSSSRQGSVVGQYARQWDNSPRGSLAGISSATLPRSRSPSAPHTSLASRGGRLSNITSPLARDNSDSNIGKIRTHKVSGGKQILSVLSSFLD